MKWRFAMTPKNKMIRTAVVCCTGKSPRLNGIDAMTVSMGCKAVLKDYPAGVRTCRFACLGGGDCVSVCRMNAIHISKDGIAEIKPELCVGCGLCAKACPQKLIQIFPVEDNIRPLCSNADSGKAAKDVCPDSCIACRICEKKCPSAAIHVTENHAVIDTEKCNACGMCAVNCPRHVIHDMNGIFAAV